MQTQTPSAARQTSVNALMLCGWKVNVRMAHSTCQLKCEWQLYVWSFINTCHTWPPWRWVSCIKRCTNLHVDFVLVRCGEEVVSWYVWRGDAV